MTDRPAADSVASPEATVVATPVVACDGGGGPDGAADGHPRVYLNFGEAAVLDCPYCGRRFTRRAEAHSATA